jgi:hypothetical protein
MTESPRRFPSPWHADPIPGGYVVRDAKGQALAYLYSGENEAEARQAKVLTADEARRVARNIARLGHSGSVLVFHAYPVGPSPHDDAMPDGVIKVQVEFHWQIGSILQP